MTSREVVGLSQYHTQHVQLHMLHGQQGFLPALVSVQPWDCSECLRWLSCQQTSGLQAAKSSCLVSMFGCFAPCSEDVCVYTATSPELCLAVQIPSRQKVLFLFLFSTSFLFVSTSSYFFC